MESMILQKITFGFTFQIVLSIAIAWMFCAILTEYEVFPSDENKYGFAARTDKLDRLHNAKWFRFPYPGISQPGVSL